MNSKIYSSINKLTIKRIGVPVTIAIAILITEYFVGNWMGFLFDDSSTLSILNHFMPTYTANTEEDAVFFNVGYDKQLVAVKDEHGDSIGSEVVTDRKTLLKFLDVAEKTGYRYLFLDIRFEKEFTTGLDSVLFSKISRMPNIVISTHAEGDGYEIADHALQAKAGYADYRSTYFSGFTKYSYLQNDSASIALRMFRDIQGGNLIRKGPFYFSNGRLCNNMQFLTFSEDDVGEYEDDTSQFPALGGEILPIQNEEELAEMMTDKIVIVGDMIHDIQTTYAGDVPGPKLNLRAYEALKEGRHIVDLKLILLLFIIYCSCAYLVMYAHTIRIPRRISKKMYRHPLIMFILLNIGWGFVMFIVKLSAFFMFGVSIIIIIPSLIFSIISMPNSYKNFKKKNEISA